MPDAKPDERITAALDLQRYDQLTHDAALGENLWTALRLACERGDGEIARHHAKQIAILTRSVLTLVKRLGQPEPDDARQ
jgi:hypothetical protein